MNPTLDQIPHKTVLAVKASLRRCGFMRISSVMAAVMTGLMALVAFVELNAAAAPETNAVAASLGTNETLALKARLALFANMAASTAKTNTGSSTQTGLS